MVTIGLNYAGGGKGIRTPDTLTGKHAFQACALNHSAISPNILVVIQTISSYYYILHPSKDNYISTHNIN
jgi:hypothetical protein